MPVSAAEREDDFRANREDIQQLKMTLARIDERLARLETSQAQFASTATEVATLRSRVEIMFSLGRWLGSIFGLAAVYGILAASNRLSVDETEIKSVDSRVGFLETQHNGIDNRLEKYESQTKGIDGRLTVTETQHRNLEQQLGEIRQVQNQRPAETTAELDERIKRIAQIIVDSATRPPATSKPVP